jgi:hypothetical protein
LLRAAIIAGEMGAVVSGPQMYRGMVERVTGIPRACGAWLALLALALQLGLSIGHVHQIGQGWGSAAASSQAKPILGPAGDRSPPGVPAIPAEDRCPICFGLAVSGTFILATAVSVILAPALAAARLKMSAEIADLPLRSFFLAQPRAPPATAILA